MDTHHRPSPGRLARQRSHAPNNLLFATILVPEHSRAQQVFMQIRSGSRLEPSTALADWRAVAIDLRVIIAAGDVADEKV